jgi:hypothetical protein
MSTSNDNVHKPGEQTRSNDLSKHEEFLLKEYESATGLTNHIDELRNKLTSFYLTFAGFAVAAIALLVKGEAKTVLFEKAEGLIAVLLLIIALIGAIVVMGLARLRKVQIEYFRIINNIREYFLDKDYDLWNRIQLSRKTLPNPNRRSGTYMWLLLVMLISSSLLAMSIYLFLVKFFSFVLSGYGQWISALSFFVFLLFQDQLYFKWASPPPELDYSEQNPPF